MPHGHQHGAHVCALKAVSLGRVAKAFTCPFVQFLVHIAKKLETLHEAGWVHRDLKPGNTIWLPSQNKWSLIDFGCAAKTGEHAPLAFSLYYAAPETIEAFTRKEATIVADPAVDVWALGVRSFASMQHAVSAAAIDRAAILAASQRRCRIRS